MSLDMELLYGEILQFKNGLTPAGLAPTSCCSFFEKGTTFLCFLHCQRLSYNYFSAMAKSADDDVHLLPFPTSITDLASVIGDYFEDCCTRDHKDYLQGGLPGSRYVVNEVGLTFLVVNTANNKETQFCYNNEDNVATTTQ